MGHGPPLNTLHQPTDIHTTNFENTALYGN